MEAVRLALRRWRDFGGRSRRSEFWWFQLAYLLVLELAWVAEGDRAVLFGYGPLTLAAEVVLFVPGLAVGMRRLQDTGHEGWLYVPMMAAVFVPGAWYDTTAFILVFGVYQLGLLLLLVQEGVRGPNAWGPSPKFAREEGVDEGAAEVG